MPATNAPLRFQAALLPVAQQRTRLDEVYDRAPGETRAGRRGAQKILEQRAASGAELGQDHRIGPADIPPQIGAPQPDQFAEDLADLGAVMKSPAVPSGSCHA